LDIVPEFKSSEEKDVDIWFKHMESKEFRALNVAEGELQLVLSAIVTRSRNSAEEFAYLDQDISCEKARDYLCASFGIRNAEEIWEDRLRCIEIRDGETLRSYRQQMLDLVYLLGRIQI
jgi:hypothetical protein